MPGGEPKGMGLEQPVGVRGGYPEEAKEEPERGLHCRCLWYAWMDRGWQARDLGVRKGIPGS